ncbi:MAG: HET-C-related protein [Solirubrobacteraceae bacterium]
MRAERIHAGVEPSAEPGVAAPDVAAPIASWLGSAERLDPRARARLVQRLQRANGNAAVGRALAPKRMLQRFEAPVHEAAERHGLTLDAAGNVAAGGLTNEEASAVYMGNWMRDLNQVFVPLITGILPPDVVFSMLAYIGAKKFGRTFTSEQFGYYIPAEHIDSPAGLTKQDDLLPGPPKVNEPVVPGAKARDAPYVTPQLDPEPWAADQPFAADQTGTMRYIRRTNEHVEKRLELAARRGRNPEGMMHFGAALHAVEDLFAHSNYVEIALSDLLSKEKDLLPGAERAVFTFSKAQKVEGRDGERPILMTGSFTGADTKISLTSEITKFMQEPLPPPKNNAERAVEERFITTLLKAFETQLSSNPKLRATIKGLIKSKLPPFGGDTVAEMIVSAPLSDIYNLTRMPNLPDAVRELLEPIRAVIRQAISEQVLQPAAHRLQAEGLNAQVRDTTLIKFLRDQKAASARPFADLKPAELELMKETEKLSGKTPQQQHDEATKSAQRHVTALNPLPDRVVGGPTHSQIAKDHPNSPFYGIAFKLAAEAVRRMRDKMVAAWEEQQPGAGTKAFDFSQFPVPDTDTSEVGKNARELYQGTRPGRIVNETKSQERGRQVVRQGGDPGHGAFTPYDVRAMRADSSAQIRAAASGLRAIAGAPADAAKAAQDLNGLLGKLDSQAERVAAARKALDRFAGGAAAAGAGPDAQACRDLADKLDANAGEVDRATTLDQCEQVNARLTGLRNQAVVELAKAPTASRGLAGLILIVLDQQIADTAPAYSTEQRDVILGKELPDNQQPNAPIATSAYGWTDAGKTIDSAWQGGVRGPALRALIEESRLLLNHPYENRWWEAPMREYAKSTNGGAQLRADIEARNAGYATFRRPGEQREGHGH